MPIRPKAEQPPKAAAKKPRKAAVRKKPVEPKKPAGRPSKYTDAVAEVICSLIAEGTPLRVICREPDMPSWRTVYDWRDKLPEFSARLARAREIGQDFIAEETIEIIDETPQRMATEAGSKIDPGFVQWQKNRVEQRMKLLAVWNPRFNGRHDTPPAGPAAGQPAPGQGAAPTAKMTTSDPIEASREYQKIMGGA